MRGNPFYHDDPFNNFTGIGHGADWGTRRPYNTRSRSIWGPGGGGRQDSYSRPGTSGGSMFSDMRSMGPSMSYSMDPDSSYGGSQYGGSRYGGSGYGGGGRNLRTPPGFPPRGSPYYGWGRR